MIQGKKEIIERVRKALPGDPAVYVNMDAIEQLPDEFESTIVEVEYKIDHDFSDVSKNKTPSWYPSVFLMNRIAEKRGIMGYGDSVVEIIYEDVNISIMEMCNDPVVMKMKVGYSVKKRGAVMQEDGTLSPSSQRIGMYNAWGECCKLWTKEEMYSEGYTKKTDYPPKYNSKWKRRYHFQQTLEKALGMADSTAWSKCIRELTGMQTGYSTAELKECKFYFAKIRRSKLAIKAEAAARLTALSHGQKEEIVDTSLLFESTEPEQKQDDFPVAEPFVAPSLMSTFQETKRKLFIGLIEKYQSQNLVPNDAIETINAVLKWLKANKEAERDAEYWSKAIGIFQTLEKVIPEVGRIEHNLY